MQSTTLYQQHRSLGAKMVDFGGWNMPVSYKSVLQEHEVVRSDVGIFDVSHMGEIFVSGPQATPFLRYIAMNDVLKLNPGMGQYSGILNERGGFVDDLIIYKLTENDYLICTNASNTEKDSGWIETHARKFDVAVKNRSHEFAQLAIQGPRSKEIMKALFPDTHAWEELRYTGVIELKETQIYIARTGYTGEWGYEIYLPNELVAGIWEKALEYGAFPIGLGARDTLRLEACYLLYGNDMNEDVSPLEAGVAWAVKLDRDNEFLGQRALLSQKASGQYRRMFAFKMEEEGIPRHGMKIFDRNQKEIGVVTSGSVLPTLGGAGGMCLINNGDIGEQVTIDVRGKTKLARLTDRPLYKARTK